MMLSHNARLSPFYRHAIPASLFTFLTQREEEWSVGLSPLKRNTWGCLAGLRNTSLTAAAAAAAAGCCAQRR